MTQTTFTSATDHVSVDHYVNLIGASNEMLGLVKDWFRIEEVYTWI